MDPHPLGASDLRFLLGVLLPALALAAFASWQVLALNPRQAGSGAYSSARRSISCRAFTGACRLSVLSK